MIDSPINDEMLEHYWKHGFVVVPGLIPQEDLQPWLGRLSDIVEGRVAAAKGMLVMRDVMVAKGKVKPGSRMEAIAKIQDFENDPVLDSYTTWPGCSTASNGSSGGTSRRSTPC